MVSVLLQPPFPSWFSLRLGLEFLVRTFFFFEDFHYCFRSASKPRTFTRSQENNNSPRISGKITAFRQYHWRTSSTNLLLQAPEIAQESSLVCDLIPLLFPGLPQLLSNLWPAGRPAALHSAYSFGAGEPSHGPLHADLRGRSKPSLLHRLRAGTARFLRPGVANLSALLQSGATAQPSFHVPHVAHVQQSSRRSRGRLARTSSFADLTSAALWALRSPRLAPRLFLRAQVSPRRAKKAFFNDCSVLLNGNAFNVGCWRNRPTVLCR